MLLTCEQKNIRQDAFNNGSKYEKIEIVGQGAYGVVWKGRCKETGELVALKSVEVDNIGEGVSVNHTCEVKILQCLKHENILNLRQVYMESDEANCGKSHLVMALDYVPHDLSGIINDQAIEMNQAQIKSYVQQLLRAIDFMHRNNVMHRDLKSSNILVTEEGTIKLADFGLARVVDPQKPHPKLSFNVVTRWYRAPELLLHDTHYTSAIDIWSVGCILAELMFKTPLFPGHDEEDQLEKIFSLCGTPDKEDWFEATDLPNWPRMSPSYSSSGRLQTHCHQFQDNPVVDLLQKMLTLNPRKRITASQALNHPWFSEDPLPDHTSCKLPMSPRNESWVRKFIEEQQNKKRRREAEKHHQEEDGDAECTKISPVRPLKKRKIFATNQSSEQYKNSTYAKY